MSGTAQNVKITLQLRTNVSIVLFMAAVIYNSGLFLSFK